MNNLNIYMKYVVLIGILFLIACSVEIKPETEPSTHICEKTINITMYREERTPYGEPRCEQMPYNFTRSFSYIEGVINDKRMGTCTFIIKNEEDMSGTFKMYPNILKQGKISDGADQTHLIDAFGTAKFEWNFELDNGQTASCLIQCSDCPHRIKCFYLQPITYQIRQIPYIVQEKRNVTC